MFPSPIGEETGKADTNEAARQDVQHESPEELFSVHGHLALFATVGIILPAESDLAVGNRHNPVIGNGDAPLTEKALDAIAQWKFRPGVKDGQPVTVAATVEVNFRLL